MISVRSVGAEKVETRKSSHKEEYFLIILLRKRMLLQSSRDSQQLHSGANPLFKDNVSGNVNLSDLVQGLDNLEVLWLSEAWLATFVVVLLKCNLISCALRGHAPELVV